MRRFGWLTAVLVLLSATAAWAQDAVAVLTEIQTRKGQVQVRTTSDADWVTPKPLQALRAGDQVRVTGDARAALVFTGGRGTQLVTQSNSPFKVDVKGEGAVTDRAKAVLGNVTNFLLGQQREKTYQSLSVRSMPEPRILAPRDTQVLAGAPLSVEWAGSSWLRYTVRVLGPQGPVWQQADIARGPLPYAGPPLVPGARYTLEIEPKDPNPRGAKQFEVLRTNFGVLSSDDARRVRESLAVLTPDAAKGYPPNTLVLMRAALLFQEKLYADARRELMAGIAQYPEEATLHELLGHVYGRTGLTQLAGNEFDEAEALAAGR